MTAEDFKQGVKVASVDAQLIAPIVGIFNPGIGAAMSLLTPVAEHFIINTTEMIINFKKDMSVEEMIEALNASKSINWPIPSSINAVSS